MDAEKVRRLEDKHWEIEISLDVRLSLAFTVLKAAHLSLFHIHGYHYALGAAGRFLGSILGDFFKQNQGKKKPQVIEAAKTYLSPFVHMIRPLQAAGGGDTFFRGTLDDGLILLCRAGSGGYWGTVVFVNFGKTLWGSASGA